MQERAGPRPFDVTTRSLIEGDPVGWLTWIGLPVNGPVEPVEPNADTVLAQADKVLRINASPPWLAHLELQASYDPLLPARMLQYNALLLNRHQMVVESTVVLLRPEADGPGMTGLFEQFGPTGLRTISFGFHIVKLWRRPVEDLLNGGLGTLPLAPLADVEPERLHDLLDHLNERFRREALPSVAEELWSATFLLLGLRYDEATTREVERRMSWLEESRTYQAILARGEARGLAQGEATGRIAEARRLLVVLGQDRLGAPGPGSLAAIDEIDDLDRLERLIRRTTTASTWAELLVPMTGQ